VRVYVSNVSMLTVDSVHALMYGHYWATSMGKRVRRETRFRRNVRARVFVDCTFVSSCPFPSLQSQCCRLFRYVHTYTLRVVVCACATVTDVFVVLQMIFGIFVIVSSLPCSKQPWNHWSALTMYFCESRRSRVCVFACLVSDAAAAPAYFVLFAWFFVERYLLSGGSARAKAE
jgi:hypothetical protein